MSAGIESEGGSTKSVLQDTLKNRLREDHEIVHKLTLARLLKNHLGCYVSLLLGLLHEGVDTGGRGASRLILVLVELSLLTCHVSGIYKNETAFTLIWSLQTGGQYLIQLV